LPGIDQLFTYNFKHGGTPLMDLPLAVNPSGCARCEPCFRTLIKHRNKPLVSSSPKKKPPLVSSNSSSAFNAEVIPREARSSKWKLIRKTVEEFITNEFKLGVQPTPASAPRIAVGWTRRLSGPTKHPASLKRCYAHPIIATNQGSHHPIRSTHNTGGW